MARLTCVYINTCSLCLWQPSPLVLVNAAVIGAVVVVVVVVSAVTIVVVIVAVALCAWPQVDDVVTPGKWADHFMRS